MLAVRFVLVFDISGWSGRIHGSALCSCEASPVLMFWLSEPQIFKVDTHVLFPGCKMHRPTGTILFRVRTLFSAFYVNQSVCLFFVFRPCSISKCTLLRSKFSVPHLANVTGRMQFVALRIISFTQSLFILMHHWSSYTTLYSARASGYLAPVLARVQTVRNSVDCASKQLTGIDAPVLLNSPQTSSV